MGTRTKILTASVAVLAFAMALPALAQDSPPQVAVAYVDTTVDGPVGHALAEFAQRQGHDVTAGPAAVLAEHWERISPDCVVTVGLDGDRIAAAFADRFDVEAISAQGADRHHTATMAGHALASCLG